MRVLTFLVGFAINFVAVPALYRVSTLFMKTPAEDMEEANASVEEQSAE